MDWLYSGLLALVAALLSAVITIWINNRYSVPLEYKRKRYEMAYSEYIKIKNQTYIEISKKLLMARRYVELLFTGLKLREVDFSNLSELECVAVLRDKMIMEKDIEYFQKISNTHNIVVAKDWISNNKEDLEESSIYDSILSLTDCVQGNMIFVHEEIYHLIMQTTCKFVLLLAAKSKRKEHYINILKRSCGKNKYNTHEFIASLSNTVKDDIYKEANEHIGLIFGKMEKELNSPNLFDKGAKKRKKEKSKGKKTEEKST